VCPSKLAKGCPSNLNEVSIFLTDRYSSPVVGGGVGGGVVFGAMIGNYLSFFTVPFLSRCTPRE
jgi:hypothetical protein